MGTTPSARMKKGEVEGEIQAAVDATADAGPASTNEPVSDGGEVPAPSLHAVTDDDQAPPADDAWEFDGIKIGNEIEPALMSKLAELSTTLGAELLIISHGHGHGPAGIESLNEVVYQQVRRLTADIRGRDVVLVLDSPGGQADAAYRIARLLQRSTSSFSVAVPGWAKSAATLLSLGAQRVYMGSCAEFGPLDVQLFTHEREEWSSALDEVQSLDRITEAAITQADQAMLFLLARTGKKMETLLPYALDFAAKLQAPMVDKIDTIHYTQQSRMLKVAEDYAIRLMTPREGADKAKDVANRLVNAYPEHGFVIDKQEARGMLPVDSDPDIEVMLDDIGELLRASAHVLVGRVKKQEKTDDAND